jgi:hypothetical protein
VVGLADFVENAITESFAIMSKQELEWEGKYSEEMEMREPALIGAEARHSHLASQD